MACDMPEPFKFPSLDSCQKRFLWTHREVRGGLDLKYQESVSPVKNKLYIDWRSGFLSFFLFFFLFFFFLCVCVWDVLVPVALCGLLLLLFCFVSPVWCFGSQTRVTLFNCVCVCVSRSISLLFYLLRVLQDELATWHQQRAVVRVAIYLSHVSWLSHTFSEQSIG